MFKCPYVISSSGFKVDFSSCFSQTDVLGAECLTHNVARLPLFVRVRGRATEKANQGYVMFQHLQVSLATSLKKKKT